MARVLGEVLVFFAAVDCLAVVLTCEGIPSKPSQPHKVFQIAEVPNVIAACTLRAFFWKLAKIRIRPCRKEGGSFVPLLAASSLNHKAFAPFVKVLNQKADFVSTVRHRYSVEYVPLGKMMVEPKRGAIRTS